MDYNLRKHWLLQAQSGILPGDSEKNRGFPGKLPDGGQRCDGRYGGALNSVDLNTETWEKKGTYRNGYLLNFVLGIRDSFISEPDDYSAGAVKKLEKNYTEADSSKSESDVKDPTIIVIMNESFSDLSVLGNLETNQPVTPFMDSLRQNTIRGYALSSVYGAPPNSE